VTTPPTPPPTPPRTMRLFVAVWPPPAVIELVGALARPAVPGLRWTTPDQWHVTLVFLGARDVDEVRTAFHAAPLPRGPVPAMLGPTTGRFGRRIVHVPVVGLDEVATGMRAVLPGDDDRPFRGHLTLARARDRRGVDLSSVVGAAISASFPVSEVTLVASHLGGASGRGPAQYEVVDRRGL
jgi:2'-5' RNA ligase